MEDKKILLEKLIQRNDQLRPIVFVGFETMEELNAHREKVETEKNEYFKNQEQIWSLEWELMTPEQQQRKRETPAKIKAKAIQGGQL